MPFCFVKHPQRTYLIIGVTFYLSRFENKIIKAVTFRIKLDKMKTTIFFQSLSKRYMVNLYERLYYGFYILSISKYKLAIQVISKCFDDINYHSVISDTGYRKKINNHWQESNFEFRCFATIKNATIFDFSLHKSE